MFGEQLDEKDDSVLPSLQSFVSGELELQMEALKSLTESSLVVLERQFKDFLDEPEPSIDAFEKASSAPTHNMASERRLGCLDKMMRHAPIATGGFLSGKVKSR